MEVLAQGLVELLFGEASRAARRRRAEAFAAAHGLRFRAEGRPEEAADRFEELEMIGVPFVQPVADTCWGDLQGRQVIAFENPVWNKGKRRNVPYRFTAVRLARAVPDLLVAAEAPAWFRPDVPCRPVPGSQAVAADPAAAGSVLQGLDRAPLAWMARANWVVGWHRGRLRRRGADEALRFLTAAADACEHA